MKIGVLTEFSFPMFADRHRIFGGTEAVALQAIKALHYAGHDMHVFHVGPVDEYFKQFATYHCVGNKYRNDCKSSRETASLTREVSKNMLNMAIKANCDVYLSHTISPTIAAKLSKLHPVIHQVHVVIQDAITLKNFVNQTSKITSNGSFVYATEFTKLEIEELYNKTKQRQFGDIPDTSIDSMFNAEAKHFFYANDDFEEVLPAEFDAIQVGRYTKSSMTKNFHRIAKIDMPVEMHVAGDKDSEIIQALIAAPKTTVHVNAPRHFTVDRFRRAKTVILAGVVETAGLTAFEGLLCGATPICYVTNSYERNGTAMIVEKILPGFKVPVIAYKGNNWKQQTIDTIESIDGSLEARLEIANATRKALTMDNYIKEITPLIDKVKSNYSSLQNISAFAETLF